MIDWGMVVTYKRQKEVSMAHPDTFSENRATAKRCHARLNRAFAGIGSNVGNPVENCNEAIRRISESDCIEVFRVSSLYRAEPVGMLAQAWFVNCAVSLMTSLDPCALLSRFRAVEDSMGRIRLERWGERIIDLDLLLYNDKQIRDNTLIVPHPRMHERRFVLAPMAEIAPEMVHPALKRDMRSLLTGIEGQEVRRVRP